MRSPLAVVHAAIERHVKEPSDSHEDVEHKKMNVELSIIMLAILLCVNLPLTLLDLEDGMPAYFYPGTVVGVVNAVAGVIVAWRLKGNLQTWVYVWNAIAYCWLLTYQDLVNIRRLERFWTYFVLLIDWLLVARAPHWLSGVVVAYVCVYLIVVEVELTTRFGLLNLPLVKFKSNEKFEKILACEDPPCATGNFEVYVVGGFITVFAVDFFLTRRFAVALKREKEQLKTALKAAEGIAASLVRFDLAAAVAELETLGPQLPPDMHSALTGLIENLGSYRPYLPHELFGGEPGTGRSADCVTGIPGALSSEASILFTDIKSSTSMWDIDATAMRDALDIHNTIIRDACAAHNGYEVKTIGDSFMLAFHTATTAVQCALRVQERFAATEFPRDLRRKDMNDGFPVLSIRAGVHVGEVLLEQNVVTGRYDYFGPTVNIAARVEAMGIPGTVTITRAVLAAIEDPGDLVDGEGAPPPHLVDYTHGRVARGMVEPLYLTALLPAVTNIELSLVEKFCSALPLHVTSIQSSPTSETTLDTISLTDTTSFRAPDSVTPFPLDHTFRTACPSSLHYLGRCLRACASVAAVRFNTWHLHEGLRDWELVEARSSQQLEALSSCVKQTSGYLSTVTNDVAYVSWNVHRSEAQHVAQAIRFAMMLHDDGVRYAAGIATGGVASVQVGASDTRRFFTLMGPTVTASSLLLAGAQEVGTQVLVASLGVDEVASFSAVDFLRPHLTQVDTWTVAPRDDPDLADTHWCDCGSISVLRVDMPALCAAQNEKDDVSSIATHALRVAHLQGIAHLQHGPLRFAQGVLFRQITHVDTARTEDLISV